MHGNNSGCDLVKWMHPGGDLWTTRIMFDDVKCLEEWMTFDYNVYDLIIIKWWQLSFVTCNMKTQTFNVFNSEN
jgi:hypothetical protein